MLCVRERPSTHTHTQYTGFVTDELERKKSKEPSSSIAWGETARVKPRSNAVKTMEKTGRAVDERSVYTTLVSPAARPLATAPRQMRVFDTVHHTPPLPLVNFQTSIQGGNESLYPLGKLRICSSIIFRRTIGVNDNGSTRPVRPGPNPLAPASLHRHIPYFGLVLFFHDFNFRECSPTYSKTCRCSNLTNEKNERFRREGTSRPNLGGRDPPSARPTRLVFFDGSLARPAGFPPLSIDTSTLWKHRPPTSPTFLPLFLTLPKLDRCPTLGLRQAGREWARARQPRPSRTVLWTCTFFS